MAIDSAFVGGTYPGMNSDAGASLGLRASASSSFAGAPAAEELTVENAMPTLPSVSSLGVLGGLVTFVVMLLALMFIAHRIGTETEFKNIKVSAYNALVISLAAIIGIPVFKLIFTKFQVPGVSHWVLSA